MAAADPVSDKPGVTVGLDGAPPPAKAAERKLPYEVDLEGKAKTIIPAFTRHCFQQPHMMAFHLSWISFFFTFVATFAPAALIPVIRDNLFLRRTELGNAGVAAVCGAIAARIGMGAFLDTVGPRYGIASTMLLTAPAVFCMAIVSDFSSFACVRFFIGVSLCMFVCCQFWCGTMFNVRIVGTVNAIAAGWGNMGGGATHLIMPLIYIGIKENLNVPGFQAWRWAFFVPGFIYMLCGVGTALLGIDDPSGKDYRTLKAEGVFKTKGAVWPVLKCGLMNYRTWILALTYGYSFGVELTVDNVITEYLFDQFGLDLHVAGALGSVFGLMNLFTRATGGMLSDLVAIRWGMRGRIWALWIVQTLGGIFCIVLGIVDYDLGATIAVMVIFSVFCQQACGLHFGVAPFVSRRAYGVVSGVIGAGGNTGAAVTQALFYAGKDAWQVNLSKQDGFKYMGYMTIGLTMSLFLIYFPMWGSMLTSPREGVTEEDYYLKEWSPEEVSKGLHNASMRFAMESRSQRSYKDRMALEATATPSDSPSAAVQPAKA